jgi:hypothetical protein
MASSVTEDLFNKVISSIEAFGDKWSNSNHIDLLSEASMQAWIFHHLLTELTLDQAFEQASDSIDEQNIYSGIRIHCCPPYLDNKPEDNGQLRIRPDIAILDRSEGRVPSRGVKPEARMP